MYLGPSSVHSCTSLINLTCTSLNAHVNLSGPMVLVYAVGVSTAPIVTKLNAKRYA